jgi:PilZ domain
MNRPVGTIVQFRSTSSALLKQEPGDNRGSPRRRVLKAGIAASNDRHLTAACTVRDISDTGARLRLESSLGVPDTFELIIETDGFEADCEVVWRSKNEVGVRFLGAPRRVATKRAQIVTPLVPASTQSLRRKPKGTVR